MKEAEVRRSRCGTSRITLRGVLDSHVSISYVQRFFVSKLDISPRVLTPMIYVNSYFVGSAAGSFVAQSLVDAIWSLGMRSLSAGCL